MLLENPEYSIEESGIDSSPGLDFEHNHVPFCRDGAYPTAGAGSCPDLSTLALRTPRIQHIYGNVFPHGRDKRRRMQDLGSKVRQIGGFVEAQFANHPSIRAKLGISRHNPVDVSPYFDP